MKKRKLLAMSMELCMAAGMMAGCSGGKAEETEAPAETEAAGGEAEAEE